MNLTLTFAFEKETKGAVRYQETDPDGTPAFAPKIGSLYVRKSALASSAIPRWITVVVTESSD